MKKGPSTKLFKPEKPIAASGEPQDQLRNKVWKANMSVLSVKDRFSWAYVLFLYVYDSIGTNLSLQSQVEQAFSFRLAKSRCATKLRKKKKIEECQRIWKSY